MINFIKLSKLKLIVFCFLFLLMPLLKTTAVLPDKPSTIVHGNYVEFIDYIPVNKIEIKWFGGLSFILTKLKITTNFNQSIITFIVVNIILFIVYYLLSCLLVFIFNKNKIKNRLL